MKVPKGLDGSLKPALERIIVFEIADKTWSWPTIDFLVHSHFK